MESADPLAKVSALGASASRAGVPFGFGLAALLHGTVLLTAALGVRVAAARPHGLAAVELAELPVEVQARERPVDRPAPAPPSVAAPPRPRADLGRAPRLPASAPPPEDSPAQATRILTSEAEAAAPVVTGDATELHSGFVSADGDGRGLGRGGGGRGSAASGGAAPPGKPPAAPPPVDRSRPAALLNGYIERCDFPEGAERNEAVATVVVIVGVDARPVGADVVTDPGEGFGRQARGCLLRQLYRAARDRDGRLVAAKTTPIRVRFTR